MKLLFVPNVVQSFIDLILIALMEPQGYAPYENIYQEVDYGDHDKTVYLRIPLEYPSEKTYNGIKSDAVKNNAYNKFILWYVSVRNQPENSR